LLQISNTLQLNRKQLATSYQQQVILLTVVGNVTVATYQVEAHYEMPLVAGYWLLVATYQVEAFE